MYIYKTLILRIFNCIFVLSLHNMYEINETIILNGK